MSLDEFLLLKNFITDRLFVFFDFPTVTKVEAGEEGSSGFSPFGLGEIKPSSEASKFRSMFRGTTARARVFLSLREATHSSGVSGSESMWLLDRTTSSSFLISSSDNDCPLKILFLKILRIKFKFLILPLLSVDIAPLLRLFLP